MFLLKSGYFCFVLFVFVIFQPSNLAGQIYRVAEMNTKQIRNLDKQKTVVILTGGVLEQHGPFMPSFSDGYINERYSRDLSEAIAARSGWSVLMFPTIPLGTGGANEIGYKNVFPGSYGVRASTLRTVFMDLATQLGEQGFRWVFIVHGHGSPLHNQALDQAGDYFRDSFGGRMVNLDGLLPKPIADLPPLPTLSEKEQEENGFDIHAGMSELSRILYIRPDLVDSSYKTARPFSASSMESLVQIARGDSWLGYFGSPRLATASRGAQIYRRQSLQLIDVGLKILDGLDERTIPRFANESLSDPAEFAVSKGSIKRDEEMESRQREWLRKKKLQ
jgi:creatinine amidohydrolase/Fe(II)-dependent formamide hydrolase-like protein